MEDSVIIELFYERSEQAIVELSKKYGKYCEKIAYNITQNSQDAEECVNDSYLKFWNTVPPCDPRPITAYLGRIVRSTAIDRIRTRDACKRTYGFEEIFDDLSNCISDHGTSSVDDAVSEHELILEINSFLRTLDKSERFLFIRRYFYCDSVKEIAKTLGKKTHYVTVKLSRIKDKLKNHLKTKGVLV